MLGVMLLMGVVAGRAELGGIGMRLWREKPTDDCAVTEVLPGSPAQRADIRPGDKVLAVDGVMIDASINNPTTLVRGEAGSRVQLHLLRGQQRLEKVIERVPASELYLVEDARLLEAEFKSSLPRMDYHLRASARSGVQAANPTKPIPRVEIYVHAERGDWVLLLEELPTPSQGPAFTVFLKGRRAEFIDHARYATNFNHVVELTIEGKAVKIKQGEMHFIAQDRMRRSYEKLLQSGGAPEGPNPFSENVVGFDFDLRKARVRSEDLEKRHGRQVDSLDFFRRALARERDQFPAFHGRVIDRQGRDKGVMTIFAAPNEPRRFTLVFSYPDGTSMLEGLQGQDFNTFSALRTP